MDISSVRVPWATVLLLGSFLSLVPGMAFVNCAGNGKKLPKPVGEETLRQAWMSEKQVAAWLPFALNVSHCGENEKKLLF